MHRFLTRALLGLSLMLATSLAFAQVPPYVTYSGYLEDNGTPVSSTVTAVFEVFDADSGGTAIWSETHNAVAVLDGEFVVELGTSGSQLSSTLFNGRELWLQITVNGDVLNPRIALDSVPYAFFAATAGRVDWANLVSVPAGLSDGDQDTKPSAACNTNQFLRWDGSAYSCSTPAESDPQIGDMTSGRWCTSDGTHVNCTEAVPTATETDPQVGSLTNGRWCTSDGTQVNCTETVPTATETDPQVGSLTAGRWCTSDGTTVNCAQTAPLTAETDPQVGSLTAGRWCTSDGTTVNCAQTAPSLTEVDPKVGAVTSGRWCRGSGSQVVCDIGAASCATKTMSSATCGSGTEHMRVVQCVCGSGYTGSGSFQCINGTWSTVYGGSCNRDSCFAAGAQVLLADGQSLAIENIEIGAKLRSALGGINTVVAFDRPVLWQHKDQALLSINAGPWHMTDNHPVLTRQGWKALAPKSAELEALDLLRGKVGQLQIGDVIVGDADNEIVVRSIRVHKPLDPIKLYNFVLDGDHTFVVDNMAVMSFVPDAAGCLLAEDEHSQLEPTLTLATCDTAISSTITY